MTSDFREIHWPYESHEPTECPECKRVAKVDAATKCYWLDNFLELRCRFCGHQWTLGTLNWSLVGKVFQGGERIDGRETRTESGGRREQV